MSVQTRLFTLSGTALAVALTAVAPTAVGMASTARADVLALSVPSVPSVVAPMVPAPPGKALPTAVDLRMPYQAQVSCDPRAKPGVTAFAALMRAHYMTGATGTFRPCQADTSEHYDGRAVDWMNSVNDPRQKAVADSVTAWLSADSGVMARRFGISYIIWNHRMWREYAPERGWVLYTGAVPHTDHIHFSFSWDGAMQRTSWWTGRATTVVDQGPCRVFAGQYAPLYQAFRTAVCPTNLPAAPASPYPVCVIGQKNAQIVVAQRVLGVTADGDFGMGTFNTLVSWQTRAAVPVTGVLDKATWAKLVPTPPAPAPPPVAKPPVAPAATTPYTAYKRVVLRQGSRGSAVVFLQRALKVTPDGAFGPRTRSSLVTFQAQHRMSPNGVADRLVWDRLEKRDYPLLAYRGLTLRQGSRGLAVAAVQRALRVTANGVFGSVTGASVKAVQSRARLAPTGVVSGWTWVAIERQIAR